MKYAPSDTEDIEQYTRLTAVCMIGREHQTKDVANVVEPYSIWEFVRWETSNYLEKQISAELAVMPALSVLLTLQIEMNLV